MRRSALSVLAALAVAALPVAGAQAKPHGHKLGDHPGKSERGKQRSERGKQRSERGKQKSRKCAKLRRVGFVVEGAFGAYAAPNVSIAEVREANRHARDWLAANAASFSTDGARVAFDGVTDGDGDGSVTFADVAGTDSVKVIGKLAKPKRGCAGEQALTVRRVRVTRP